MLDTKNFTVRTRVQQVNYLDGQARQRLIFVENLCRFWSKRGQELEKLPVIAQAPLDVCRCAGDVWCALVPFRRAVCKLGLSQRCSRTVLRNPILCSVVAKPPPR